MLGKLISTAIILFVSIISLKAQEYFQIQNRWKADEFIHVEQPKPATGSKMTYGRGGSLIPAG